jgi:hypothetical protein
MAEVNRRRFIIETTTAAAALASLGGTQALGADRQLGTCGPPPRMNATRQTAAEGMPPLPLPAVPLRRSEPKAEPAPPLMMAKLEYGTTQDWNTDPGDADNLMRHVRQAVGLWYGWKHMNIEELVALHKADKQCKIPSLYISGHEAFEFTKDQRAALVQYLVDGGTLIGDACCGREEFATSFRREVKVMFHDRAFDVLQLDHPIFRAFHKYTSVNVRTFPMGMKTDTEAPPELLGMNLGCRTAVVLSPYDMSCGWDDHTHEHGSRLLPGDAVRLGINLISYIAAMRQVAETQAVTRLISDKTDRPRQQFVLAQLRHQGDWDPDPNSTVQMLRFLSGESSLAVSFDLKSVDPSETKLAPFPFLYMTGFRDPKLTDDEVAALRRHLQAGGFLFINNCSGYNAFDRAARALSARLFPDQKLAPVPADDAIFKSLHTITKGKDRQTNEERPIELEGVHIKNRLVLVYSKNDMVTQLKQVSDPFGNGYDADTCRKLAVNIVAYALQN